MLVIERANFMVTPQQETRFQKTTFFRVFIGKMYVANVKFTFSQCINIQYVVYFTVAKNVYHAARVFFSTFGP